MQIKNLNLLPNSYALTNHLLRIHDYHVYYLPTSSCQHSLWTLPYKDYSNTNLVPNLVWLTVYFHPSTSSLCNIVTMQYYRFCCQKSFLSYKRQCSSRTTDTWCPDPKFTTKLLPYTQIDIPENVWKAYFFRKNAG